MKSKLYYLLFILAFVALAGCNETLNIETETQGLPKISEFAPISGCAGTEVTVKGENLRDIVSATIGGVEAQILYKLSQEEIVIVVPREGTKSGKIALSASLQEDEEEGMRVESEGEFTVTYPVPTVTAVPESVKVGDWMEIAGVNLNVISRVSIGGKEAVIIYQSEKELVVEMPFVVESQTTLALTYSDDTGDKEIRGESEAITVIKDEPEFNSDQINDVIVENSLIPLVGKRLNLIDHLYVICNNQKIEVEITKEPELITFKVPALPETISGVKIVAQYYETSQIVLSESCTIKIPKVFYYEDIMLGAHRNTSVGNLLNAKDGKVETACIFTANNPLLSTIDFSATINTGSTGSTSGVFALYSPQKTISSLYNYRCGGSAFLNNTQKTEDAIKEAGFGDFIKTITKFKILKAGDNQTLIDKVKANGIDEISNEATPEIFAIAPGDTQIKTTDNTGTVDTKTFVEGDVILFKNEETNKYGILYIKRINMDWTDTKENNQKNASITFSLYYQRY